MNPVPRIRIMGDSLKPCRYKRFASFRRIDNFVNSTGAIIALTDDESLLAPNAIIVDKFHTEKYIEIIIHSNSISLINQPNVGITPHYEYIPYDEKGIHQVSIPHQENPVFQVESISIYDSGFAWPENDVAQMQDTIQGFLTCHASLLPRESLLSLLIPSTPGLLNDNLNSAFDRAAFIAFEHAFSLLHAHFFDSISAFHGKGRGLTPAGDDFIAGLLYGIHCLESLTNRNHMMVKARVYENALGSNLFTNNMLQLALNAKYFKRLKNFLSALVCGNSETSQTAFRQLVSAGHTSGADLIAGFFAFILQKPLIFDQ